MKSYNDFLQKIQKPELVGDFFSLVSPLRCYDIDITGNLEKSMGDKFKERVGQTLFSRFVETLRKFLGKAWIALFLFAVSTTLEKKYDEAAPLIWLQQQSFFLLHRFLTVDPREELPIVIVDISPLKTVSVDETNAPKPGFAFASQLDYTPRSALSNLVFALSRANAKAIGIDIDFSPDFNSAEPPPGQMEFLDYCRQVTSNGVPVFLGVGRAASGSPDSWLGGKSFASLAACALRFNKGENSRMPTELSFEHGQGKPLPSLSAALAGEYARTEGLPSGGREWWRHRLEATTSEDSLGREGAKLKIKNTLVNYQFLSLLRRDHRYGFSGRDLLEVAKLHTEEQSKLELNLRELVRDKLVLIGDADAILNSDEVKVPGEIKSVPGVFTHACAVCTLTKCPLSEMAWWKGSLIALVLLLPLLYGDFIVSEKLNKPRKTSCKLRLTSTGKRTKIWVSIKATYAVSRKPIILIAVAVLQISLLWAVTLAFASQLHLLWLSFISISLSTIVECFVLIITETAKE